MKIVKLKCPSCGANLKVDNNSKNIKCEYCGNSIYLDDEIIKVEHTIVDSSKEQKFENAENCLYKIKDYYQAYHIYSELSNEYSSDCRVWKGLIISSTRNFKDRYNLAHRKYYSNYKKTGGNEQDFIDAYEKFNKRSKYIDKLYIIICSIVLLLSLLLIIFAN